MFGTSYEFSGDDLSSERHFPRCLPGGIVFPIYRELGIPVRYIGVGETLDDLVEFNAEDYVASLLGLGVE